VTWRGILFDLDGTLVDSRRDIATAVNRVRGELGRDPMTVEAVGELVGEGARVLLEQALPPLAPIAFEAAFASFRRHYDRVCVDHTTFFPGMRELLEEARRHSLAVLTNKPEAMSRKILAHLGVADRFGAIVGGDTLAVRKPDPETVHATSRRLGLTSADVVLVGDSLIDAGTAEAAGCGLLLVSWGFRPRAELATAGAVLCDDVAALRAHLRL
jgi:phosphoglycolate phosphatase